jgi:NADH dehydrogenase (ubiquinone) 1 alpha subcomplex subunit 6
VGEGLVQNTGNKDQGKTDFLKNFYTSNYFWTGDVYFSSFT